MPIKYKIYPLIALLSMLETGCLHRYPWEPGKYNLREIMQEYEKGTYIETFQPLPYEEKMNICIGWFTRVKPPLSIMAAIFRDSGHETADRVKQDLIQSINDEDEYMVWVKTLIWKEITRGKYDEYRNDCRNIINLLKTHEGGYWDTCVRVLQRDCCIETRTG